MMVQTSMWQLVIHGFSGNLLPIQSYPEKFLLFSKRLLNVGEVSRGRSKEYNNSVHLQGIPQTRLVPPDVVITLKSGYYIMN